MRCSREEKAPLAIALALALAASQVLLWSSALGRRASPAARADAGGFIRSDFQGTLDRWDDGFWATDLSRTRRDQADVDSREQRTSYRSTV